MFVISGQKYPLEKLTDNVVFIDTYFYADQIVRENHYQDSCFPGVTDVLSKLELDYVYVPKIVKATNLVVFFKMLRALKKEKIPVLTEYQLLGAEDFLRLLQFVIVYPFYIARLILGLGDKFEDRLAKYALWAFSGVSCATYYRLLYGKKISCLPVSKIKCVSWYENQALDKCFYRGLRKNSRKVLIYGAQLFIWPPTHMNVHVDDREIQFGVVPDKILVSGNYFLKKSKVNIQIGPSLRYKNMFQPQVVPAKREDILVLFSYWEYEISNILNCLKGVSCKGKVRMKFHPLTNTEKFMGQIGGNAEIVKGDIYSQFKAVGMVIGSATGALVEAASLGIPVINIVNKKQFSHMYFPEFGKGLIWDSATTNTEVLRLIEKFDFALKNEEEKLTKAALKMREMFFCEPTEKKIIEAFDLV